MRALRALGHISTNLQQNQVVWHRVRSRTDVTWQQANNDFSSVATSNAATIETVNVCLEKFAMKLNYRLCAAVSAVLLVSSLALGGCAGMTHQEKNTATGAVIGGVVGNVLCGGVACTAAGAAVGGVIGHEVRK
jgi:osmotically inducible lipoprotein OsmB